jgi:hypothetical protein
MLHEFHYEFRKSISMRKTFRALNLTETQWFRRMSGFKGFVFCAHHTHTRQQAHRERGKTVNGNHTLTWITTRKSIFVTKLGYILFRRLYIRTYTHKDNISVRFIIVITQFQVTMAMNCRVLTPCINWVTQVTNERAVLFSVSFLFSKWRNILM